jgi:hypothetical protein
MSVIKDIASKTGDAKIDRQGQTTHRMVGSDPNIKAIRRPEPTDLRP